RASGVDPQAIRAEEADVSAEPEAAQGSLTFTRRIDRHVASDGPLLSVDGVSKSFGGVHAVDGVTFEVQPGEIVGLIGPNGAGKTTLFELIGGFTKADAGRVGFAGRDITGMGPEGRGRLGLIR